MTNEQPIWLGPVRLPGRPKQWLGPVRCSAEGPALSSRPQGPQEKKRLQADAGKRAG